MRISVLTVCVDFFSAHSEELLRVIADRSTGGVSVSVTIETLFTLSSGHISLFILIIIIGQWAL